MSTCALSCTRVQYIPTNQLAHGKRVHSSPTAGGHALLACIWFATFITELLLLRWLHAPNWNILILMHANRAQYIENSITHELTTCGHSLVVLPPVLYIPLIVMCNYSPVAAAAAAVAVAVVIRNGMGAKRPLRQQLIKFMAAFARWQTCRLLCDRANKRSRRASNYYLHYIRKYLRRSTPAGAGVLCTAARSCVSVCVCSY